ncbi:MAG: helix-turn-helix transcriptional regulator [Rhizobiaceae bacterium]
MTSSHHELNSLIGNIYDCAVQPELWPQTLNTIKQSLDLAFLQVVSVDGYRLRQGQAVQTPAFKTLFEHGWLNEFARHFNKIPGGHDWIEAEIDTPISQMQLVSEAEFKESDFYKEWIGPKGLRDSCTTPLVKRDHLICALTASGSASRDLFDDRDRDMIRQLSPHIRRSLMIGDMLDEGNYKLSLYRDILDRISTGVMIVTHGAKLVYANGAADDLLRAGHNIKVRNGQIESAYAAFAGGLRAALERACSDDDSDIGNFGNGIPLPSRDGETAVCYVLPLGKSDHRRSLGPGHAAVFISGAGTNMPPSLEILSALSGLTSREANIALMIADGNTPADAAGKLGVTMNTMRTHLSHIFDKTGANSQPALVRYVSSLSMPVRMTAAH